LIATLSFWPQVSDRELRKLNDKQRRLQETVARNKADALRDDDNVFDVSYESQGGAGDAGDTVSATDIKVLRIRRSQLAGSGKHLAATSRILRSTR